MLAVTIISGLLLQRIGFVIPQLACHRDALTHMFLLNRSTDGCRERPLQIQDEATLFPRRSALRML